MNFKPESGGFAQKVSDLQNYKLIKKDASGNFTLTEASVKIFSTTDKTQLSEILYTVVINVDLWKSIAVKYKGNIDGVSLIKDLIDLTGLMRLERRNKLTM